jgi:hypothetical protein
MSENAERQDETISIRLDRELADELDRISRDRHQTLGEIVVQFTRDGVERDRRNTCRACSAPNRPGARYCQACGRALFAEGEEKIVEGLRDARGSPEYQHLLKLLRRDLGLD